MPVAETLLPLLRCPHCKSALRTGGDSLHCESPTCARIFPGAESVPILIDEDRSIFRIADFLAARPTFFKPKNPLRGWISGTLPDISGNVSSQKNFRHLRELLETRVGDEPVRVLVLGGSIIGAGMEPLLASDRIEFIETDVAIGPRTQLICDAHDLPLADESIDAVIVQAVLEHVVDPIRCVAEIHRVLKSDGLVYSDTPFMQQVHGREFDFTRFTRLGHRRLFRQFSEVESGITCGPGMALAWSMRYFLMSFFTSPRLRAAVSGGSRLAFFWLKYFDYLLVNRRGALDAASAFYFLGRKQQQTLSDRELVDSYAGGF